jgi:RNA polymerase sigma-70 factor (ECF subfamily)
LGAGRDIWTSPDKYLSVGSHEIDREGFATLFRAHAPRVRAYVRRRCDAPTTDDIVSEVFLLAWRRHSDLPNEPLPWLLVVARNLVANRRRAFARAERLRLEVEGIARLASPEPDLENVVADRETMLHLLASLTSLEREAVLLIAWDGLSTTDAAKVAGCSPRAFTVRLHRARRRLARALDSDLRLEADPVLDTELSELLKERS